VLTPHDHHRKRSITDPDITCFAVQAPGGSSYDVLMGELVEQQSWLLCAVMTLCSQTDVCTSAADNSDIILGHISQLQVCCSLYLLLATTARSQHSQECKDPRQQCFDVDIRPFDPKINGFPGLIVEHFYVKFLILAASVFDISCRKTDIHINGGKIYPLRLPPAWVTSTRFYLSCCNNEKST